MLFFGRGAPPLPRIPVQIDCGPVDQVSSEAHSRLRGVREGSPEVQDSVIFKPQISIELVKFFKIFKEFMTKFFKNFKELMKIFFKISKEFLGHTKKSRIP